MSLVEAIYFDNRLKIKLFESNKGEKLVTRRLQLKTIDFFVLQDRKNHFSDVHFASLKQKQTCVFQL